MLKIKKYISRGLLLKLGLFLVLMGGAWLFDHYHQFNGTTPETTQPAGKENTKETVCFFCTLQSSLSVKAPVQKVTVHKMGQEKLNRLIREQQNARSAFMLKAEVLKQPGSLLIRRNLVSFRHHFLHHPDDQPPLA